MNTLRLGNGNIDMEKLMITISMTLMEVFGAVMLFCAFFDIRIL